MTASSVLALVCLGIILARYQALGCMLFDVVSVIATQLTECLRRRTAELLTLEDAQSLTENDQLRALSLTEQQEAVLTGPDRSAALQLAQSLCWSFQERGFQPVFLSSLAGRRTLSQVFRNQECSAAVLSWAEVVPGTKVIELEDSSGK